MKNAIKLTALAVAGLTTLAACVTTDTDYSNHGAGYSSHGKNKSHQATSAAESACMAAVNRQYGGKYDVRVVRSEYSEANSLVMVDANPVGGMTERWRCLVSNDGVVQELKPAQGKPTARQSSSGDLVGMRARNLDAEMAGRGFKNVGGYQAAGAAIGTWWNAGSRECLSVETRQGQVSKVEAIAEGNCR